MRVAVVSDIHGNLDALNFFINFIEDEKIDKVLNLGDILGGIDPIGALRIIMKDNRFINVCGNHDEELSFLNDELTLEEVNWIKALPKSKIVNILDKKFLMLHSRKESNKDIPILFNNGSLIEFLNDYKGEFEYVLFGHTHYQCLVSFYEGKTMINPGSLGLSYDNKISFCILNINENDIGIEFKKYNYVNFRNK